MFEFLKRPTNKNAIPQASPPVLNSDSEAAFGAPLNEFEQLLIAKHRKELDIYDFLDAFFNAKLGLLVPEDQLDLSGGEPRLVQNPRLFSIIKPDANYLAFFSCAERAKPAMSRYPQYRHVATVRAGDFIMSLHPGFGIVINPYWDINFWWAPDQVNDIRGIMKKP